MRGWWFGVAELGFGFMACRRAGDWGEGNDGGRSGGSRDMELGQGREERELTSFGHDGD